VSPLLFPIQSLPAQTGYRWFPTKGLILLSAGNSINSPPIALARNTAGVHWRSDGIEGLQLGEAVAIGILTDLRTTCPENFTGFTFTKFAGTAVTI